MWMPPPLNPVRFKGGTPQNPLDFSPRAKSMRQNLPGTSPYEPIIGFSRAVRVGSAVHVSGTGPVGADDADVETQTRRIFEIAAEVLQRAGSSLNDVVRTRMYLTHAADWETVGRVHGEYFSQVRPAATMVVVAQLLNPQWRVEIELDAVIPSAEGQ
jgi:enamine deaminase RidA (YjgF/YER057c/UK114 family)